jgi:small basic protein
MDKHYAVPMTFTQKVLAQNQFTNSLIDKYATRAGEALAYTQEGLLLSLYSSMSQSVSGLTNLTVAAILEAKRYIFQAGVPQYVGDQREKFALVVTPKQYEQMLQINNIATASTFGVPTAIKGVLEELYGCQIYVTNNIAVDSAFYNNMLFHKDYAMVGTQLGVNFIIEPGIQPHTLSRKASVGHLYGYVEKRDGLGVRLPTTT